MEMFWPPATPSPARRRLDPFGDEVEGRASLHLDRIVGVVGEDVGRSVVRRIVSPPAFQSESPIRRGSGRTCSAP